MYKNISTNYDVFKETLIYGARLEGKYGFPVLKPCKGIVVPRWTVNFRTGMKKGLSTNVNFFMHDYQIASVWNNPDKYLRFLSETASVCGFDFTIDTKSPLALQIYNKYRNHAISYYFGRMGICVIPKVDILIGCSDWIYDGMPRKSILCCSTKGRTSIRARREFQEAFKEMENMLNPIAVMVVGGKIPLDSRCDIIYAEEIDKM